MRAMITALFVAAAVPTAPGSITDTQAGPTFVDQTRTVLAQADADSVDTDPVHDSHSASATNYGLFDTDVSATAQSGSGDGAASASQSTTFTATGVVGEGSGHGQGGGDLSGGGGGTGDSFLEVVFVLEEATPYTATGSVAMGGDDGFLLSSFAELTLTGPGGTVFDAIADFECAPGCVVPVVEAGILAPGQYVLTANAHAQGGGGYGIGFQSGNASFDFGLELDLACPEDIDRSGAVDFGEILAILGAWGVPGGPEDLDGSGLVDFGDILQVLRDWGPCA